MDWIIDEKHRQHERLKAKELKKSRWWQNLIQSTHCYYCQLKLDRSTTTMDHIVPISRGGRSTKGNLVPCCRSCNLQKRSLTPIEWQDYLTGQLSVLQASDTAETCKPKKQ